MRLHFRHYLCLLLLWQPVCLLAQSWSFRQYTSEQGLPSSEVYDILQDRKGYIWVATDRGVARFDGYTFESFTTGEGLSNNVVFRLAEGPDGKIWFGEMPGTLSYYQGGKIYPAPENAAIRKRFAFTSFPVSILPGKDYVDVGYEGYGLFRLQHGQLQDINPNSMARIVLERTDGMLYGSTKKPAGLSVYYQGRTHSLTYGTWCWGDQIRALKRYNGDLIVTFAGSVWIIKKSGQIKKYGNSHLAAFSETQDSCLYALSAKGFYRYGPNEDFVPDNRPLHLDAYRINKVIMDREGGLWLATLNKGVLYCPHPGFKTYEFDGETLRNDNLVYSICGDFKNKVFVGLQNGSVYYFKRGREPERIFSSSEKGVGRTHIFYDTLNDYLLASQTRLLDNKYRAEIRHRPVPTGNGIVPYKHGYIHGGYRTFFFVTPGKKKNGHWPFTVISRDEPKLQCLFRLNEDSIFGGTLSGLCLYSKGILSPMLQGTPYARERINDIECIDRRHLALATIGRGLVLYDMRTGILDSITQDKGLLSDVVNDVAIAPDGTLWLATNKGLSRLRKQANGQYAILNYNNNTGLPVVDLKNVYADSSTVYIGTHNGLVLFDPASTTLDHDPEILLRAAYVNDRPVMPAALTGLNFRQNNLRISFLSIIPKMQGHVLYRYQLQEENDDHYWVYVREPELFLSSVEPGSYKLVIQACNNTGQWSKVPLVLPIYITAPFWKTGWFFSCCILVAGGIVIFLYRLKLRHIREKIGSERLMLDYQQQALINQINPHFLFNSMNSIQKYILREDKERAVSFVSKFAKLMRLGLEQSREAFIPLTKELELLQVYMLLEGERFGKKITYRLEIQEGLREQHLMIPPMLIQPFIENAIRHGILNKQGNGEVILRLYCKMQLLYCEVEDDGIGREKAIRIKQEQGQLHQSFAISINTSRLQLLAQSLNSVYFFDVIDKTDEAGNPSGTLVKLVIPFKHEH